MPMGEMGDYQFINHGGEMIGAVMRTQSDGRRPTWSFYFGVPEIDAAAAKIGAQGGTIHAGPMEIPGGEYAVVASDPQGVMFGIVGPRK
jgi:predicted enzyme related to lactoylglutathione lyase